MTNKIIIENVQKQYEDLLRVHNDKFECASFDQDNNTFRCILKWQTRLADCLIIFQSSKNHWLFENIKAKETTDDIMLYEPFPIGFS